MTTSPTGSLRQSRHPGFALLDIWELCTAHFVRANRFSRRGIEQTMDDLGLSWILYQRDVAGYTEAYRIAHAAELGDSLSVAPQCIATEFSNQLAAPQTLLLAGSAGAKVRSAARIVAEAAIRSGLWVTQKDDVPVTVKTGHSLSQLTLSPQAEPLGPVVVPNVLVLLSTMGCAKCGTARRDGPGGHRRRASCACRTHHGGQGPHRRSGHVADSDRLERPSAGACGRGHRHAGVVRYRRTALRRFVWAFGESNARAVDAGLALAVS